MLSVATDLFTRALSRCEVDDVVVDELTLISEIDI